jgi:hypothetical protein|nr:MAG TPA: hypothetical protein [Caudoviricetes sp.]DAS08430.1 MAG TPA: hypothetical protein [Caudoviricetes sp.]
MAEAIDHRQILVDVATIPILSVYIDFTYSDPAFDKRVKLERDYRYRVTFLEDRVLMRLVGTITNIRRIFDPEIETNGGEPMPPEYVITLDASSKYGSNVKKIRTSQIRDVKRYTEYMDEDPTILDAEVHGGTTVGKSTDIVIRHVDYDEDNGIIKGGQVDSGKVIGDTTNGITNGKIDNGKTVTVVDNVVDGGKIDSGVVIHAEVDNDMPHEIVVDPDGSKSFHGSIVNFIIVNTHITGGKSTGGKIVDIETFNTTVYGGIISGKNMYTIGGVTKGEITYGGTTIGGTVVGGDAIGTWNGRVIHRDGDIVTVDGVTNGGVITGGTVIGGNRIGEYIYNATVVGGTGTANITSGGTTTGGKITVKEFDTSKYTINKGDVSDEAKNRAYEIIKNNDSRYSGRKTDEGWERIAEGLIVTWDPNRGVRSNIADRNARITDEIDKFKFNATAVETADPNDKSHNNVAAHP